MYSNVSAYNKYIVYNKTIILMKHDIPLEVIYETDETPDAEERLARIFEFLLLPVEDKKDLTDG
jgi:hypothetical protein